MIKNYTCSEVRMSTLTKIKAIDQSTKDLTFGYIRKSTKCIKYTTIPMMINYVCLLYYHVIMDQFVRKEAGFIVSSNETDDNPKGMVKINAYNIKRSGNIHGNIIVNPRKNPKVIATWIIKVNTTRCIIGIHSKYDGNCINFGQKDAKNYAWGNGGAVIVPGTISYDDYDKFKAGDVIKLELNVPKQQLKFYKNDKETDFWIDDIDLSQNYHLMVNMFGLTEHSTNDSVEIIDFKIKNYKSLSFFQPTKYNYMYNEQDKFIKCDPSFNNWRILSSDKSDTNKADIVKWFEGDDPWMMVSGHGNIIINPRDNPGMIATWILKINSEKCFLGVAPVYVYNVFNIWHERHSFYSVENVNLTVKMEFDVSLGKLRFYQGGRLVKNVDINMSWNYHLTVRMLHPMRNDSVQLIDFYARNYESVLETMI